MHMNNITDLIIVGNGLDIWQGLPTKFSDFQIFYETHKDKICEILGIKPGIIDNPVTKEQYKFNYFEYFYWFLDEDIMSMLLSDIPLIEIGNEISPKAFFCNNFWSRFEDNLYRLDIHAILRAFGDDEPDIELFRQDIADLLKILKTCIFLWIATVEIKQIDSGYDFSNAFCINFNYTDTLQKRFNVKKWQNFHIHGSVKNPDRIIIGHGNINVETDEYIWDYKQNRKIAEEFAMMRFMLYKDHGEQISKLKKYLRNKNLSLSQFRDIYVLGLSLGNSDTAYFRYISRHCPNAVWHVSYHSPQDKKQLLYRLKKLRIKNFELIQDIPDAIKKFKKA